MHVVIIFTFKNSLYFVCIYNIQRDDILYSLFSSLTSRALCETVMHSIPATTLQPSLLEDITAMCRSHYTFQFQHFSLFFYSEISVYLFLCPCLMPSLVLPNIIFLLQRLVQAINFFTINSRTKFKSEDRDTSHMKAYWIATHYPFIPAGKSHRHTNRGKTTEKMKTF